MLFAKRLSLVLCRSCVPLITRCLIHKVLARVSSGSDAVMGRTRQEYRVVLGIRLCLR